LNGWGKEYFHYKCQNFLLKQHNCDFSKYVNEVYVEKDLLDNLDQYINTYISEVEITNNRADVDNEQINKQIKDLQLEMKNTTTAFRKGRMTEKEYDKEYEDLEIRLKDLESHLEPQLERDFTIYHDLLKSGWRELYMALTKENKRAFWRKYIKEIKVNKDGTFNRVIFF
jgi:septal ring factor EnvC (AmiA/AmiB activator)